MRTRERFLKLKKWAEENLCEGRVMKCPSPDWNIAKITRQQPKVYVAWYPMRMDQRGNMQIPENLSPSILIMPVVSYSKMVEEKRFDQYHGVHQPKDLGNQLSIQMLFSVYEPGIRLPGFIDSAGEKGKGLDTSLFIEGTEEGFFTLTDWMDDAVTALLRDMCIPGTDLFLNEETLTRSLYTDQQYVTDRRPVYYGFINCTFGGYADQGKRKIESLLN